MLCPGVVAVVGLAVLVSRTVAAGAIATLVPADGEVTSAPAGVAARAVPTTATCPASTSAWVAV